MPGCEPLLAVGGASDVAAIAGTGGPTVDYAYDGEGNQVKAGNDTFTYNLDHTVASATVGGVKTSYSYDGLGVQLSAVSNIPGGPRVHSWATDVNTALPRTAIETSATPTSSTSRGFLTGPGGIPLTLFTGGRADTYLPDWLGGVADLIGGQDQTLAAYDYDPSGNPRTGGTAGPTRSTLDNPIRFAGLYLDPTLGQRYTTAVVSHIGICELCCNGQ
jgi:hypothetical protein